MSIASLSFPHCCQNLPSLSLKSSFLSKPTKTQFSLSFTQKRSSSHVVSMSMEAGIGVMGTKLGMMSFFETDGKVVSVTVVGFREGNVVTQVKTSATDGYDVVQVGYRRVTDNKLTKPELGHLEKAGVISMRHLQKFRLQSVEEFETGHKLDVEEIFKEGDLVDVSETTIGE
ncbi:plastid ribosomal proteins of the 50S subunit [Hibiscus trionum]|uniref:Plastid ribosomal proteins of the 50S subunit n=1 Tax=Hibiscus trionum TaxID=183268 RepID=A0A9W7J4F5_HIBTR|nr:plastid ribosomal proteins of the 50S subunit [Hibiscus trionum]